MGQINDDRVRTTEENNSFTEADLASLIKEIDTRTLGADSFVTINRISNLISSIYFYRDIARTELKMTVVFSRTTGVDNVDYITGIVITMYNANGTIDSTITRAITRDINNRITACDSVFATTEAPC